MKIEFYKYHGNGNDFIILDNRLNQIMLDNIQMAFLCHRHFGIGADGLMLLENKDGFDFSLKYFNSDGFESTMCGNGGRCMTAFAHSLGIINKKASFNAVDGLHEAEILSQNEKECIVTLKIRDTRPGQKFSDGYFIDTGSPHFVKFVPSVDEIAIMTEGRALRYDPRFAPGGCNVNFVELTPLGLSVRTYERGVENETLSCGTGVTASALITAFQYPGNKGFYLINTRGGQFKVHFSQSGPDFTGIYLEGPANFVFKGEITI
ncbi:MAG: diaminopimelate epimerase [Bacteroidetes bacterium]|nr:diaminopimelate epimerase [Bacteroidota bacterium]